VPTHSSARRVITAAAVPATLVALAGAVTFAGPALAASGTGGSGTPLPFPTAICSPSAPATRPPATGSPSPSPSGGASADPSAKPSTEPSTTPSTSATASPSSAGNAPKSPSASPSSSPTNGGILGWLGGILGAVQVPHAAVAPVLGGAGLGRAKGRATSPDPSSSVDCVSSAQASQDAAKAKADGAGSTVAANEPWHLSTPSMTMWSLTYNGISTVDTAQGPVKALNFTASKVTIVSMVTYSQQGGGKLQYNNGGSGQTVTLTDVTLLTTSLTANLLGLIHATFTPSSPPPLIVGLPTPIPLLFTDVEADNAFMNAQTLDIPGFDGYGTT
jgi:hypothetical protein